MMIGHRIHQDQIRLMADLMKTLYSQKKTEPEKNPGQPEDQKPAPVSSGMFNVQSKATVNAKNHQIMPAARRFGKKVRGFHSIPPEKIFPGMRCPECGEMFPTSDFHYTEGTGLCIPCWEKGEIACQ